MRVKDLIVYFDGPEFGHNRIWEVRSVCLGAVGQEGLVELQSLSETPGQDTEGQRHRTTWVPEPLLRFMPVFRRVNTDAVGAGQASSETTIGNAYPTTYKER